MGAKVAGSNPAPDSNQQTSGRSRTVPRRGGRHRKTAKCSRIIPRTLPFGSLALAAGSVEFLLPGELWQRLLGRPASESGTLRHGDGTHGRSDRCRRSFVLPCMKRLAVSSGRSCCSLCWVHIVAAESWGSGLRSREVPSALYSRSSRARGTRRRMRGFEGWGRHLSSGPAAAAKATFALTHPSNLRETTRLTTSSPSSQSHRPSRVHRGDGVRQGRGAAGRIHRSIPEEGIENAGQAAGQRDNGDVLAPTCSDAQGPGPERLSRGGPAAEDREGGLNEQPAHARVPGLSDGAAALRLARAVLAGHEAEIGFELMRMVEAPDVVDGGEEGGGGDGADAGDRAQPWHAGILDREVLDRRVRVRELLVEGTHDSEQGRDQREQAARQGHRPDALGETLRTAGRHTVALLAEQGPDDRDVARARVDQGVAHPEAAPHVALGIGEP